MFEWNISVFDATPDEYENLRKIGELETVVLANWEAGPGGMDWIKDMATEGTATMLKCNGFSSRYSIQAKYIQHADFWKIVCALPIGPMIIASDCLNKKRVAGLPEWISYLEVDQEGLRECPPEAVLTVEGWSLN